MSETNTTRVGNKDERLYIPNCDYLGCYDTATEKITLNAGKFGSIEVSVCSKCKEIIKRKDEMFSENESLVHPFH
jgi:hypothetical protein